MNNWAICLMLIGALTLFTCIIYIARSPVDAGLVRMGICIPFIYAAFGCFIASIILFIINSLRNWL